ncbi:MAG: AMP-binding protein [Candidatus Delongbacteria bacterium]|jgi:acyl-[acyl-carrier-protein]-phospholipid O-acyltransferase/long-chain-fatty-acid--[acyl-carrier-protein] ligase|nr:AMP-binding protein [Candidatus Delongbacteria bacterium]
MSLHSRFVDIVKKNKNRTAIIDNATGQTYTFGKLLIASLLLSSIVKKNEDEFVGIMLPKTAGGFITTLAVLFSGKIPVMINYSTGADRNIQYAKKKCRFSQVITSRKFIEKIGMKPMQGMVFLEDIIGSVSILKKITALFKSFVPKLFISKKKADDIAVLLFTTGSEKEPKAVMLSHDNILSNVEAIQKEFFIGPSDMFAGVLPLFHIFGLTTSFFLPLLSGAAVNTFANSLEYQSVANGIKKNKCTIITATPTFIRGYSQKSVAGDFESLRLVIAGGDKLNVNIKDSFYHKHGIDILEGYGTTETSPVISVNRSDNNKFGSIGQPLPGVNVKIVGIDSEEEVATGEKGKILVKGRLVMKGYYSDLEETALHIHKGWYDTGDIGVMDEDGFLWHKGRLRRFVKIGGEMVSLVAIENAIEKHMGEDELCCAVEIPHITKGAEIVVAITAEIDEKDLKKKLSKELPPIAIPKKIIYYSELPVMGNGKVNFRVVEDNCRNGC